MSIARSVLLWGSRNRWLAEQASRRAFVRRAVKRFMPGENLEAALGAAQTLATSGIGSVLTELGENVTTLGDAKAVTDHYVMVLGHIAERKLPAQISIKLTHMGLDLDPEAARRDTVRLARIAAATGETVWIDMEDSSYTDATLDLYRRVRETEPNVGLCLQAYLYRTAKDLETLLPLTPRIRLVKGAYNEPGTVAFPKKRDVDANYLALAGVLLEHAREASPVFGTHDVRIVGEIGRLADERQLPADAYEIHMLYGIGRAEQTALAAAGRRVRVLISYGGAWFPWYMRRLAERPANVWFVMRSLVK